MADLEKLLLEAAGRTSTTSRNRHSSPSSKRQRGGSYSDNGSDSRDDDSDDNRGYASRKPFGSQVPLKKRLDPTERDDDSSSQEQDDDEDIYGQESDSDNDSIGSDLYKDEEDRQKLAQMSELDREMILTERANKRTDRKLQENMRRQKEKMTQSRKDSTPPTMSRGVRSSARSADRAAAKDGALNELRAKRLRQQDPEAHWKLRDAGREGSGSRRYSAVKDRNITPATLSSSSRSENGSRSDDEESTGDGGMIDSDDEKTSTESAMPKFEDIKEITIRRSKLARWFMEPFFDELIVGCFVRVGIGKSKSGPIYRLCIVKNVDAADPDRRYKLENKTTHKYLNVVWGNESSAARWQMAMISDSPPLKEEFDQWVREVERSGGHMPSKQDVFEKRDAIKKTNMFVYSPETVKQMLNEKKSSTSRPINIAVEKEKLRREMEMAQSKNDEAGVERIKNRLQELVAAREAQGKDVKAIRLQEMNRRNRFENLRNAAEKKAAKAGEEGYDPFSRRWTRSRNYYGSKPGGDEEAAAASKGGDTAAALPVSEGNGAAGGVAETEAALKGAADVGKLVDTSAPVDQGTELNALHNFELPISLSVLEKFGGPQGVRAGFMARKQRMEATVGVKVPENDGRRHALTLTVSDYKRRRGLL